VFHIRTAGNKIAVKEQCLVVRTLSTQLVYMRLYYGNDQGTQVLGHMEVSSGALVPHGVSHTLQSN
jgi:hypothetical protein